MLVRLAGSALLAATLVVAVAEGAATADEPRPAEVPVASPAPAATLQAHGVIVVATGEGSGPAARALAMETYRDPALRPSIDEATARVLAGDPLGEGASARQKEIAELRAAVAHAESEMIARRLLASLGSELGAELVVSVALDAGRPAAHALRSAGAVVERIELGATIETAPDGTKTFRWPGATSTLRGLLGVAEAPPVEPLRPLAPKPPPAPVVPEPRPFWKSPWFWGTAGVVAAAGITVIVLSKTQGGPGDVHLTGTVGK